jgi:hypothetical protein
MSKPLSKLLIIITILVAFVGQAMAYKFMAVNDTDSNLQSTAQLQIFDNNTFGEKSSENDDDCCEIECCESECICPANACTSNVYLDTNLSLSELVILSESMLSLQSKDTHFIASSLYRPPIFTS